MVQVIAAAAVAAVAGAVVGYVNQRHQNKKIVREVLHNINTPENVVDIASDSLATLFKTRYSDVNISLSKDPKDMSLEELALFRDVLEGNVDVAGLTNTPKKEQLHNNAVSNVQMLGDSAPHIKDVPANSNAISNDKGTDNSNHNGNNIRYHKKGKGKYTKPEVPASNDEVTSTKIPDSSDTEALGTMGTAFEKAEEVKNG